MNPAVRIKSPVHRHLWVFPKLVGRVYQIRTDDPRSENAMLNPSCPTPREIVPDIPADICRQLISVDAFVFIDIRKINFGHLNGPSETRLQGLASLLGILRITPVNP